VGTLQVCNLQPSDEEKAQLVNRGHLHMIWIVPVCILVTILGNILWFYLHFERVPYRYLHVVKCPADQQGLEWPKYEYLNKPGTRSFWRSANTVEPLYRVEPRYTAHSFSKQQVKRTDRRKPEQDDMVLSSLPIKGLDDRDPDLTRRRKLWLYRFSQDHFFLGHLCFTDVTHFVVDAESLSEAIAPSISGPAYRTTQEAMIRASRHLSGRNDRVVVERTLFLNGFRPADDTLAVFEHIHEALTFRLRSVTKTLDAMSLN